MQSWFHIWFSTLQCSLLLPKFDRHLTFYFVTMQTQNIFRSIRPPVYPAWVTSIFWIMAHGMRFIFAHQEGLGEEIYWFWTARRKANRRVHGDGKTSWIFQKKIIEGSSLGWGGVIFSGRYIVTPTGLELSLFWSLTVFSIIESVSLNFWCDNMATFENTELKCS